MLVLLSWYLEYLLAKGVLHFVLPSSFWAPVLAPLADDPDDLSEDPAADFLLLAVMILGR